LETYTVLKDKKTAEDLEKYLKSGFGFAFLKKRLLPQKQNAVKDEFDVVGLGMHCDTEEWVL